MTDMTTFDRRPAWALSVALVASLVARAGAQPAPSAGSVPRVGKSAAYGAVTVTTIADGLESPWSLAFLPDGNMLVTERAGRLRIVRNGVLDPKPIAGVPEVHVVRIMGLMDIALHPRFAENGFVYLTYTKLGPPLRAGEAPMAT